MVKTLGIKVENLRKKKPFQINSYFLIVFLLLHRIDHNNLQVRTLAIQGEMSALQIIEKTRYSQDTSIINLAMLSVGETVHKVINLYYFIIKFSALTYKVKLWPYLSMKCL